MSSNLLNIAATTVAERHEQYGSAKQIGRAHV